MTFQPPGITLDSTQFQRQHNTVFHFLYHYYHDKDVKKRFFICQNILPGEIERMNQNPIRLKKGNFYEIAKNVEETLDENFHVTYKCDPNDNLNCYEVEILKNLSLFEKFESFLENVPKNEAVAFFCDSSEKFYFTLIRTLLIHLGRGEPLNGLGDKGRFVTWTSNIITEKKDLVCNSEDFRSGKKSPKIKYIVQLPKTTQKVSDNATSQYTSIKFDTDERLFAELLESKEVNQINEILGRIKENGMDPFFLPNLIGKFAQKIPTPNRRMKVRILLIIAIFYLNI